MLAWVLVAVGIAVYVPLWRIAFRHLVREEMANHRARYGCDDLPFADFFGCCLSASIFFWIAIPAMLVKKVSWASVAIALGGETGVEKRARREKELRKRESALRKAERELGIDDV